MTTFRFWINRTKEKCSLKRNEFYWKFPEYQDSGIADKTPLRICIWIKESCSLAFWNSDKACCFAYDGPSWVQTIMPWHASGQIYFKVMLGGDLLWVVLMQWMPFLSFFARTTLTVPSRDDKYMYRTPATVMPDAASCSTESYFAIRALSSSGVTCQMSRIVSLQIYRMQKWEPVLYIISVKIFQSRWFCPTIRCMKMDKLLARCLIWAAPVCCHVLMDHNPL